MNANLIKSASAVKCDFQSMFQRVEQEGEWSLSRVGL